MKTCLLIIISLLLLLTASCDRWDIPPSSHTFFKIRKDGNFLPDSTLRQLSIYYIDENNSLINNPQMDDTSFVYLAFDYFGNAEYENSGIVFYKYINNFSITKNIHDFYLKYPDGDVDTLYIKSENVSVRKGKKERCYCTTPLRELRFNGKAVEEDYSIKLNNGQAVYIFEK